MPFINRGANARNFTGVKTTCRFVDSIVLHRANCQLVCDVVKVPFRLESRGRGVIRIDWMCLQRMLRRFKLSMRLAGLKIRDVACHVTPLKSPFPVTIGGCSRKMTSIFQSQLHRYRHHYNEAFRPGKEIIARSDYHTSSAKTWC